MGILKKMVVGKFLKRIVLGLVDPASAVLKTNIESTDNKGGFGKIDYIRLTASAVSIIAVYFFLNDKIDFNELKQLIKLFW